MSRILSETILAPITVRGQEFEVLRTVWDNGVGYDITHVATALCLTPESLDSPPTADDVLAKIAILEDSGALADPYYQGEEASIAAMLASLA